MCKNLNFPFHKVDFFKKTFPHEKNFLIILLTLTLGCSAQDENSIPPHVQKLENLTVYSADAKPNNKITFKKTTIYGSTDNTLIGKMGDIAVDSSGRVFIADVKKQLIHVFKPSGRFITQLGREGKGPGEFRYIKKLRVHNNLLYAVDAGFSVSHVSVFTLNTLANDQTVILGRNRNEYKPLAKAYPGVREICVRNNGTYLAKFVTHSSNPNKVKVWENIELRGLLYFLDSTGKIASPKVIEFRETVLTNKTKGLLAPIEPFFGNALTVLSSDNTIYWAGPEYFLIKEYSPEGVYRQAFYYALQKIPLTHESAVKAGVHDYYIRNMENMDLPAHWPVLTDMIIDDQDRLWVATTVEDMKVFEWWVLKPNGELITKFNWPRSKPIQIIKNGYLYTRESKEETGLQQIVRYRFEMD